MDEASRTAKRFLIMAAIKAVIFIGRLLQFQYFDKLTTNRPAAEEEHYEISSDIR
ncbi:hypothetical protein [Terribacillus saccharophilus]|uniref:hypothetical protein n=1 Tax=Terribacillus saccharophilus TaxID=361277 RepID=UPI003981D858